MESQTEQKSLNRTTCLKKKLDLFLTRTSIHSWNSFSRSYTSYATTELSSEWNKTDLSLMSFAGETRSCLRNHHKRVSTHTILKSQVSLYSYIVK